MLRYFRLMPGTPDKINRNNRMEKRKLNTAMDVLKCLLFVDTKEFIEEKLAPWNYNTNRNSMSQNPLLYARLNFQVVYC